MLRRVTTLTFTRARALIAALVACLVAGLVVPAPTAAENGPMGPGLLDPVIGALAPLPAPATPYTSTLCADGADSCIDETIAEMKRRLRPLARGCEHDAVFSLAYLRVTQDVKKALDAGHFRDRRWLQRVDKVFAQLYFDTMDDWHAGRRAAIPAAWRIALDAEDQRSMSGLGNFLLAMNAHINRDFPHVLAVAGLTASGGRSHKGDHNAYNPRLDGLYAPVFAEMARRFDPSFDDLDAGSLDELGVGLIMRGWREIVWRHAEMLVLAPAPLRPLVEQQIEQYAAGQARMIRGLFAADSTARDRHCRSQHGR
ncbi:DUF5995 family protein [Nocardioides sp. R-C-SC26]|uniref:DUF5995 family protein n=1 Tax=Nocardioides sp. R-C-SC26 TaxID=2870414 RepID=UPI001E285946|nr:DUF5995 family protein [Nocardioides sp. R-C-SC26]